MIYEEKYCKKCGTKLLIKNKKSNDITYYDLDSGIKEHDGKYVIALYTCPNLTFLGRLNRALQGRQSVTVHTELEYKITDGKLDGMINDDGRCEVGF